MAEKYVVFIEKIIEKTKKRSMRWGYLDSNDSVYQNMGWTDFMGGPDFNTENSFYALVESYYIVLLCKKNLPSDLYVIPKTYKNVCVLDASEYGEHITRLYNLVRGQFPDAESFINKMIQE